MPMYKIIKGGENFRYHIVDEFGMPSIELMYFSKELKSNYSAKTVSTYLRELILFINWSVTDEIAVRQGWYFLGDNIQVRDLISLYLQSQLKCSLKLKNDNLGFEIKIIKPISLERKSNFNHLLAALTLFYKLMRKGNFYNYENPMIGDNAYALIREQKNKKISEFKKVKGRFPMPSVSGVDNIHNKRDSASYFRISGRSDWRPIIIADPLLQQSIFTAGEKWGWSLRELALVHILFDTGCRVHEACGITIADWQSSGFGKEIKTINKGSFGIRTKTLFLTDRTVKVLRKYVDDERYLNDFNKMKLKDLMELSEDIASDIPLFITSRSTRLSEDYFRSHFWSPALKEAGIKLRIHQIRHWYVTMAVINIKDISRTVEELEKNKNMLRLLMNWKSDMFPIYDHSIQHLDLPNFANKLHMKIEEKAVSEINNLEDLKVAKTEVVESEIKIMLNEMLKSKN